MKTCLLFFQTATAYQRTLELLVEQKIIVNLREAPYLLSTIGDPREKNLYTLDAIYLTYPIAEEYTRKMPDHVRRLAEATLRPTGYYSPIWDEVKKSE